MDENRMQVACGQQETIDALEELKGRFERSELNCAALRIFKKDGSFKDIVIGGGDDEEREEALVVLHHMYERAH